MPHLGRGLTYLSAEQAMSGAGQAVRRAAALKPQDTTPGYGFAVVCTFHECPFQTSASVLSL